LSSGTVYYCPSCGSTLEADSRAEIQDDASMGVTISAEDFNFLFASFQQLTSPHTSNDRLAEIIKTEDEIWAWLQRIKNGKPDASLVRKPTQ
jgi:hypothetical protein